VLSPDRKHALWGCIRPLTSIDVEGHRAREAAYRSTIPSTRSISPPTAGKIFNGREPSAMWASMTAASPRQESGAETAGGAPTRPPRPLRVHPRKGNGPKAHPAAGWAGTSGFDGFPVGRPPVGPAPGWAGRREIRRPSVASPEAAGASRSPFAFFLLGLSIAALSAAQTTAHAGGSSTKDSSGGSSLAPGSPHASACCSSRSTGFALGGLHRAIYIRASGARAVFAAAGAVYAHFCSGYRRGRLARVTGGRPG